MTAILNGPVTPVHLQDPLGVGLLGWAAGNPVGNFTRAEATLLLCRVPFDDERLPDVRKIKVVIEVGGGPDLAGFDSPMVRGRMLNEIRLATRAG